MTRRCSFLFCLAVLTACNPGRRAPVDPATLQTPVAAAALHYVIEHCPKRAEAELAVIVLGDQFVKPAPAFVEKFKDVERLQFIDNGRVEWSRAGGRVMRHDSQTSKPVLDLKVTSISEAKDGVQEAAVAWALREEGESFRLEMKAKPDGGYEIRELEKTALTSPAATAPK